MEYGPLFIINHKPLWLAEFNELPDPNKLDNWIRHLGLSEFPINLDENLRVHMIDYTPWDGIRGYAEYSALHVPSIILYQGPGTNLHLRFVLEAKKYQVLQ